MNKIYITNFPSKLGGVIIGSIDETICLLDWQYRANRITIDNRIKKHLNAEFVNGQTEIITRTYEQFLAFTSGEITNFDIPFIICGTDYQKLVWSEIQKIYYGEVISYSELYQSVNAGSVRSAANACGANALSLIIPCHRVIGKNNSITGYAGGVKAKEELLKLENALFKTKK